MMREIVENGDAIDLRLELQPALNALEVLQSLGNRRGLDAVVGGHRGSGGSIQHVVLASQGELELCPRLAPAHHGPTRPGNFVLKLKIGDLPVRTLLHSVTLDWAESLGQAFVDVGIGVPGDDFALPWSKVNQ